MKIVNIRIMRGPNYWSGYRKKLIVMKLDLEENEHTPTDKIPGFAESLEKLIPSLKDHHCSVGKEGGFFERVRRGTWFGHVIEHVALELQWLAGMECGYGRTRSAEREGVYHVVFSFMIEEAGTYAAKAAVRLVEALSKGEDYPVQEDIDHLIRINRRLKPGPSTEAILLEAEKRGIPYTRLDDDSLYLLGQGVNQKLICAAMVSDTSAIGVDLAGDKDATKRILEEAFISVPKGRVIFRENELEESIREIGFPFAVKPLKGNHGRGVTTKIFNHQQAINAFRLAKEISEEVILENYIPGADHRFLVINYKLVAVAKRIPAMVMGNGTSTIAELIEETNKDPERGDDHEHILTKIQVDQSTLRILEDKGLQLDSVLPLGEFLQLKDTANLSSGGTAQDVTDNVHPENIFIAERIARLMKLDICGIDIISEDVSVPFSKNGAAVLEVNAAPGLRMHLTPSVGMKRNVARPIIDMIYPPGSPSRIPVVAVTGTNGKTTTTRLIAHMARAAGHHVGYTTTEGIYINKHMLTQGDCTGPQSAAAILRDPLVDFAVLECARGGILRSGLGFDKCNISIVVNISEDHLGLDDIHTLEELVRVKSVVPENTFDDGYAILNADDDLVYGMKEDLYCNIALFSMNPDNERIQEHCRNGGLAAVTEDGYFVFYKGDTKLRLVKIEDVPLTLSGCVSCMIQNILPSILAAHISNFTNSQIRQALGTFVPSPHFTPGRMNLFHFKHFTLLVDYVHNPDGYNKLGKFMQNVRASVKIGIVSATGNRRNEDIRNIGIHVARIFDELIIRHDKDGRGRSNEQITELLVKGIREANPNVPVKIISDEEEAIRHAISEAPEDAFIMVTPDDVLETLELVEVIKSELNYDGEVEYSSKLNIYDS